MTVGLDDEFVKTVCKIGQGADCCRYLALTGGQGFSCQKHTDLRDYLDERVAKETITARGDNCEGKPAAIRTARSDREVVASIPVVDDQTARDVTNFVCCARVDTWQGPLPEGSLRGSCSNCGARILFHPSVPSDPPKICTVCMLTVMENDPNISLITSRRLQ